MAKHQFKATKSLAGPQSQKFRNNQESSLSVMEDHRKSKY